MPFIGKDWRSPGEAWVKTEEGSWEKLKIMDPSPGTDSSSSSSSSKNLSYPRSFTITIKSTREVAGYNTMSEAFHSLDFLSAISDIRRFNYVTKLLHLLINQNLTSLSGCVSKALFNLLQQLTSQVSQDQQNVHIVKELLHDIKKMISSYYCWGRPLGSTILWDQHLQTLEKICEQAAAIQIKSPGGQPQQQQKDILSTPSPSNETSETSGTTASIADQLPEELIREILLRLSDYRDVVNSTCAFGVPDLLHESHVWRKLCDYHFTRMQVRSAVNKFTHPDTGRVDYEQLFQLLRRKFGLKEEYADILVLCRYCRCLFWKSSGHPCIHNDPLPPPTTSPASPLLQPQSSPPASHDSQTSIHSLNPSQQQQQQPQQSPVQQAVLNLQQQLNEQILQQQHPNHLQQVHHQPAAHLNNNNNSNNNQQHQQRQQESSPSSVPLHIPVPPQAFLKFFSL